jgi:hypothetical protein
MEVTAPPSCACKIVGDKIVFCPLHESAERLLAACEYARKFLANLKVDPEDEKMIRQVILPILDAEIGARPKKS